MATFDNTPRAGEQPGNPYVITQVFDAASQNLAQNDIAQLIDIPGKSWVDLVWWEVLTVEGAARNFALGDGDDDDGYETTTTGNSLASGVSGPVALTEGTPNTVTAYTGGKYYATADTLDLKAVTSGGLTALKIKVSARVTRLG